MQEPDRCGTCRMGVIRICLNEEMSSSLGRFCFLRGWGGQAAAAIGLPAQEDSENLGLGLKKHRKLIKVIMGVADESI
jgi:hypothetical protein